MACCARNVTAHNGCAEKIHLIPKLSTDISVGSPNGDMIQRANILVTEVFDTELIGEGAISTFNHAHQHLLTVGLCLTGSIKSQAYSFKSLYVLFCIGRLDCCPFKG